MNQNNSGKLKVGNEAISFVEMRLAQMISDVEPSYSVEFVQFMAEKTAGALYPRLGDDEKKMLDCLLSFTVYPLLARDGKVQGAVDEEMAESVGAASKLVRFG